MAHDNVTVNTTIVVLLVMVALALGIFGSIRHDSRATGAAVAIAVGTAVYVLLAWLL